MLHEEGGTPFQVCRNPVLQCAVVQRAHHTIRDRLYKYFTSKNTYRYIDVVPKFVIAYNNTVHSTTDSDVLAIWKTMVAARGGVGSTCASAKRICSLPSLRDNFSTEIFRVAKVIEMWSRAVYELGDLNGTPIDGQFYREKLSPYHNGPDRL